jgi:ACS family D-galactonate transporter-like MFS transporter
MPRRPDGLPSRPLPVGDQVQPKLPDLALASPKPSWLHWVILALLSISVAINYVDRGNLSVALSSIEKDIHLSQDQLGILGMAFFVSYSFVQILAGKLIDRYNVIWVYAAGYLAWSGATALTGFVHGFTIAGFTVSSFAALFSLRLLLGLGESVAFPCYAKILSGSFPEGLRGTANASIDCCTKMGPAVGIMLGVELVSKFGWRFMFIVIGAVSLAWLIPWCLLAPRLRLRQHVSHIAPPPYREILSKRPFWGTVLGLFGANYTWYFFLTWLPYYFEKERHYASDRLAFFSSLPFWGVGISSICAGIIADAIIRRGRHAIRVRQTTVSSGLVGCCVLMLPAVAIENETLSLSLLMVACLCFGLFSSNHFALVQALSGPEAAGRWTGVQNGLGNCAGIVAPWVTGAILQTTHSFFLAFATACGVLLLGVTGYWFVVGKSGRVLWSTEDVATELSQAGPRIL